MKVYFFGIVACLFVFTACKSRKQSETIAVTPEQLQTKATELINSLIMDAAVSGGKLPDSVILSQSRLSKLLYEQHQYAPLWCKEENWLPAGDSLFHMIDNAQLFGLFPEDYHVKEIAAIRQKFYNDSLRKGDHKDALLWASADMMLTDAFFQMIRDVKLGRLPHDSVTLRKDSVLTDSFYMAKFSLVERQTPLTQILQSLEPGHRGYHLLKNGIPKFLDSADYRSFTKVPSPGKDLAAFKQALQKRLYEEGLLATDSIVVDSATLAQAVKRFQEKKGITVDGRAGEGTIRMLNDNDRDRFIRIAISMDKYKLLPEKMPPKYVWVNIPSYYMQLVDGDSVKINSKIIIGKAKTRTPVLTSIIHELITYPQWVPPPSIVMKEILPAVKKNPGYLAKKGFSLWDSKGEEIDPYTVDWSKYSKGVPYRIVQGSGDANALGIMKFVFANKYSVYLHDTNQRYLFGQAMRSLSHGCVRVQDWDKLTYYLLRNDSVSTGRNYSRADSVRSWLQNKQKRSVALKNKMPVFIRYITCEGRNGNVIFHDDIYGDDKMLKEKYFASK